MKIIVAGVRGSGKTPIGMRVAQRLGYQFADADAFHPPENIAKMSAGTPLTDEDRAGWLDTMGAYLAERDHVVLACSALKRAYRDRLRELAGPIRFFVLTADAALLRERLEEREHFMPPALLDSQLATLELGEDVAVVENLDAPSAVAGKLVAML